MSQNIAYYFDVNVSMPMTKDASLYYNPVLEKTLNELVIQNVWQFHKFDAIYPVPHTQLRENELEQSS